MEELKEVEHLKCSKCKCWREDKMYLNKFGRKLKTCQKCRDYDKKQRDKKNENKIKCKLCSKTIRRYKTWDDWKNRKYHYACWKELCFL